MKTIHDLSPLLWKLAGFTPHLWRFAQTMELGEAPNAEIPPLPARVPGSVQLALKEAGILPDWNVGMNSRDCEWAEHRHWIYETTIPDDWLEPGRRAMLHCDGLDYRGCVRLNGAEVGTFQGTLVPHRFDLTDSLLESGNVLQIVFEEHPNWLGQFGYTSQMTAWKSRFYYTWDWIPRLVQIGIWDPVSLVFDDGDGFDHLSVFTGADAEHHAGTIDIRGTIRGDRGQKVSAVLTRGGAMIRETTLSIDDFIAGSTLSGLDVELWYPHTHGPQPLYELTVELLDDAGEVLDAEVRRVGFRQIDWHACEGAPAAADPWLCVVNGRRVFLQGVNWSPIRPNFADVTEDEVRRRLELYRDLGCNMLRVWGGAYLERAGFYRLCDELGILLWQEFPLSSSGVDNWPPEDSTAIDEIAAIAESYIARRQHHVSLCIWCGGNELQGSLDGKKIGGGKPCDDSHPMLARLKQVVADHDPTRRFLSTSSSGPRFNAAKQDFGKGLHWDVHGPWKAGGDLDGEWTEYWSNHDALFHAEMGAPGASPVDIIREFRGDCAEMPASLQNPLWRRTSWWIEWDQFIAETGREPESLEEYVEWSQRRQAKALSIAVSSAKRRFPACGGILLWMGHDCFPCTANTAIVDFHGRPKPAALAVGEVFNTPVE